jgi:hypothetical protein
VVNLKPMKEVGIYLSYDEHVIFFEEGMGGRKSVKILVYRVQLQSFTNVFNKFPAVFRIEHF